MKDIQSQIDELNKFRENMVAFCDLQCDQNREIMELITTRHHTELTALHDKLNELIDRMNTFQEFVNLHARESELRNRLGI